MKHLDECMAFVMLPKTINTHLNP